MDVTHNFTSTLNFVLLVLIVVGDIAAIVIMSWTRRADMLALSTELEKIRKGIDRAESQRIAIAQAWARDSHPMATAAVAQCLEPVSKGSTWRVQNDVNPE